MSFRKIINLDWGKDNKVNDYVHDFIIIVAFSSLFFTHPKIIIFSLTFRGKLDWPRRMFDVMNNGRFRTVRGDKENAQECYTSSLEMRKNDVTHENSSLSKARGTNTTIWDPRLGMENERLMPTKYQKEVHIGSLGH